MKEYITTLICVSVFSIVLEVILPDSKLNKYISIMISLIIVIVIVSPIISFVNTKDIAGLLSETYNGINVDIRSGQYTISNQTYNDQIKDDVKQKIELDILNRCLANGYIANKVEVELSDEYLISKVNIYVKNEEKLNNSNKLIKDITESYELEKSKIDIINGV